MVSLRRTVPNTRYLIIQIIYDRKAYTESWSKCILMEGGSLQSFRIYHQILQILKICAVHFI